MKIFSKIFIKQLTFVASFFFVAFLCQALLFKSRTNSWVEVLGSRPWFYIETTDATLTVGGLFGSRQHSWSEVERISVVYGARGGAYLTVLGRRHKPLLKVGTTIQDFGRLVGTIKHNSKNPGVVIRERDRSGNWSEAID